MGEEGGGGVCSSSGSQKRVGQVGWEEGGGEKTEGGRERKGEGSSSTIEEWAGVVRGYSSVRLGWGGGDLVDLAPVCRRIPICRVPNIVRCARSCVDIARYIMR